MAAEHETLEQTQETLQQTHESLHQAVGQAQEAGHEAIHSAHEALAPHAAEAAHHADAAHGAAHGAGGHEMIPEVPNVITLLSHRMHDQPWVQWLHQWENLIFSGLTALFIILVTWYLSRKPNLIPRGGQNLLELFVEAIDGLARGVIGPQGSRFTPFIGTLFLFIWFMNLSVLVPGLKSPTSSLNTTVGLALVVFCYVQWLSVKEHGIVRYLHHLAGEPTDVVGWILAIIMFPLHVIGEFVKPLSLSLRLCFNIFAEDVLLAVIVGLGLSLGFLLHLPIGLPIQILIVPLILIFSTVQALVFSLLSSVYISLVMAGSDHGHGEHH